MDPQYINFDIQITADLHGYRARLLSSPVGQNSIDFHTPFTETERKSINQEILSGAGNANRAPTETRLKEIGGRLFDALFHDGLRNRFSSSLDFAQSRNERLRIQLRLTETPELIDLPWEYLYDRERDRFLGLSNQTSLVHFLELSQPSRTLTVATPLRILVMLSSPMGMPPLDIEREWQNLQNALADLVSQGLVTLERLTDATLASLQSRLRQEDFHIFHFVGHSDFDPHSQVGRLALTDENGDVYTLSAQQLATVLHNEETLRLVLLNSCQSASTSVANPFAGAGQTLVQQGVPAVIAMQFAISDQAALTFSHEFYAALGDGYPVDAAMTEARVAISTRQHGAEWGIPRLLTHTSDGILWDLQSQPAPSPINAEAAIAFRADWRLAREHVEAISHYKELHDLLHTLQFLCFTGIVQESNRFPDDDLAVEILHQHELTLQSIVNHLQSILGRTQIPTDESAWVNELAKAQNHLRESLDTLDSALLKQAIWIVRRVLDRNPPRINERMNASARSLRLSTLAEASAAIHNQKGQLQANGGIIRQVLVDLDTLQALIQQLGRLIRSHDEWQRVDVELRRIEAVLHLDMVELEMSWPELKVMVSPLYGKYSQERWAESLHNASERLDLELVAQNPAKIRLHFHRFRRQVNSRFYQVDKELKQLSEILHQTAEPLATALEMLLVERA